MSRFDAWLASSHAGDQFTYHSGSGVLLGSPIIERVQAAYDRGEIELAQRRTVKPKDTRARGEAGIGAFDYLAIKRAEIAQRSRKGCLLIKAEDA